MQSASARIWTRNAVSIFNDDNPNPNPAKNMVCMMTFRDLSPVIRGVFTFGISYCSLEPSPSDFAENHWTDKPICYKGPTNVALSQTR